MTRRLLLTLLAAVAAAFVVAAVQAQGNVTDNDVNEIAKGLYCPVCPNTPLDVCETQACQDWREDIRSRLSAGWTKEQITDYFVEQYGEQVLAEPKRRGFTSMVWILPVVALVLGIVVVSQALCSWKTVQRVTATADPLTALNPETLAQIEQELRQLE
jgi:cytochrome c-type biogenesis protein CcmH